MKNYVINKEIEKVTNDLAVDFAYKLIAIYEESNEYDEYPISFYTMDLFDIEFMYWDDQWELMRAYYNSPVDANWHDTVDKFLDDVYGLIEEVED